MLAEPSLEVLFLRPSFHRQEMAGHGFLTQHGAGVGRKNHIGHVGLRLNQYHVGMNCDGIAQPRPLLFRQVQRQVSFVAIHPRIYCVVHGEEIRRAHEYFVFGHSGGIPNKRRRDITPFDDRLRRRIWCSRDYQR